MKKYVDILGAAAPSVKSASHVADIVAAMAPPAAPAPGAMVPAKASPTVASATMKAAKAVAHWEAQKAAAKAVSKSGKK